MKAPYANKLAMTHVVIVTLDKFEDVYTDLPTFVRASEEFRALVNRIDKLALQQSNQAGNAAEKARALETLGDVAFEVASGSLACATADGNDVLAGHVDFARTDITRGRDSTVINRCKGIHEAAMGNVDLLADYGVTASKLSVLKKKIDAFDGVKSSPRQKRAARGAATRQLPALFRQVNTLLKKRLDRLIVQFKMSHPDFYNQYQTSRVIHDQRGGRAAKATTATITPATATEATKAA